VEWSRIRFTEHVTEAAAVVAECQIVIDFGEVERAGYDIKVFESLRGGGAERYFAVGINRDEPAGYRPVASGATPEDALQACIAGAGIYHRRRVKQAGDPPIDRSTGS